MRAKFVHLDKNCPSIAVSDEITSSILPGAVFAIPRRPIQPLLSLRFRSLNPGIRQRLTNHYFSGLNRDSGEPRKSLQVTPRQITGVFALKPAQQW